VTTVLLEKNIATPPTEGMVDIILGPSYYWFRKKILPVKTVAAAKKLAPSVFDPIVAPGEYAYFIIRQDKGEFWLFAYDEAAIAGAITQAGLRANMIRNLYFAQTECRGERPLRVGDDRVLADIDGTVTLLPAGYVEETEPMDACLTAQQRSGRRVPISLYRNAFVDRKTLRKLTVVAGIFALIYSSNYIVNLQRLDALDEAYGKIMEAYRLPQTSFERDGLLDSLSKKQKRQAAMRDKLNALLSLAAGEKRNYQYLTLTPRTVSLAVKAKDDKELKYFKTRLAALIKITSENADGALWRVKGTYE
jgi:hypothetical protein